MLTPEQLAKYRSGWQVRKEQKERQLAQRYRQAMERAKLAADHLKQNYDCKVILFGSLARGTHFDHRSDIDLMVEGFPAEANYWRMLVELEEITAPVEVNVVLSEDAGPGLRDKARREGKPL